MGEKISEQAAAENIVLSSRQIKQAEEQYYKKRYGHKYEFDLNKDSLNYYATVKTPS